MAVTPERHLEYELTIVGLMFAVLDKVGLVGTEEVIVGFSFLGGNT